MAKAGASNIVETSAAATVRAAASSATIAAQRAALEAIRTGDQRAVREAEAELMATGDVVPAAAYSESEEEETGNLDEESPEIDMADEDSSQLDGWDAEPEWRPETLITPGCTAEDELEAEVTSEPFRIVVEAGVCRFERPEWWCCRAVTPTGQSFVADNERRFRMMSAIASWLSANRRAFLLDPDFWNLGVNALQEFEEGWAPVVQKAFLVHTGIEHFAGRSLFSRNIQNTDLVFETGSMPLGFLFEPQARMAWVANAVVQLVAKAGWKVKDALENFAKTAIPKGREEDWESKSLEGLDLEGKIIKANAMANTGWENVIKAYKERMLA